MRVDLTLKRMRSWRKFIGYFGLSIDAVPYMVGKKNLYFFHIVYIQIPSSVSSIYQGTILTKSLSCNHESYVCTNQVNIAAEILPHISSVLRDLGVIFDKYILSSSTKLVDADPTGTSNSRYGTQSQPQSQYAMCFFVDFVSHIVSLKYQ